MSPLEELIERLAEKAAALDRLAERADHDEWLRLSGKAEGVRLAASFAREMR